MLEWLRLADFFGFFPHREQVRIIWLKSKIKNRNAKMVDDWGKCMYTYHNLLRARSILNTDLAVKDWFEPEQVYSFI